MTWQFVIYSHATLNGNISMLFVKGIQYSNTLFT